MQMSEHTDGTDVENAIMDCVQKNFSDFHTAEAGSYDGSADLMTGKWAAWHFINNGQPNFILRPFI